MVLLIDNFDSFTFNLYQQIRELGVDVTVQNNESVDLRKITSGLYSGIVISPGPGLPEDAGQSLSVISQFAERVPILGICLGHQCIAHAFDYRVSLAEKIVHGKIQKITHSESGVFSGLRSPMQATRYHSLVVKDNDSGLFNVDARSADGEIMAISHKDYAVFGIQFHPESYGTDLGSVLMKNFLEACDERTHTNS